MHGFRRWFRRDPNRGGNNNFREEQDEDGVDDVNELEDALRGIGQHLQNNEAPEIMLQIEDFEAWLAANALRNDGGTGVDSVLNRTEIHERVKAEQEYEKTVHQDIFRQNDEYEAMCHNEKAEILESWTNRRIDLVCADGLVKNIPLRQIAATTEAVFVWASSPALEQLSTKSDSRTGNHQFTLDRFPCKSVNEFVKMATGHKDVRDVHSEYVVDCCQLAHFLRSEVLLNEIVEILMNSIDTENCLSLCQLADHLQLHSLFEKALAHLMQSLGDVKTLDELTPELRQKLETIQSAIQTSVHQNSRLYFSSLNEYLAIFGERVQYYIERLAQAEEEASTLEPGTRYYVDVQRKISAQKMRIQTLSFALQEQKKLFSKKESCIRL